MAEMSGQVKILILMVLLAIVGCSHTVNISTVDPMYERNKPQFLQNTLPSNSPEHCYNFILNSYRSDTKIGFINTMRHANYFNQKWENHRNNVYANYYAAWSSLYLIDESAIETIGRFDRYDRYITNFYQAQWYAKIVLSKAETGNDMVFKAGRELVSLTEEGRTNPRILHIFLQARHTIDIKAYNYQDTALFEKSLQEFQEIRRRHPQWLPQVILAQIRELEEKLY